MKTSLVVDDIDFNRSKARIILESMGFNVEEAKDATEIGIYFEPTSQKKIEDIDVVLIDWYLPTIEGPKLIEMIKQQQDIKIFLYTAIGDDKEGEALANEVGADGFIHKQLSKEKLEKAFKKQGLL